MATIPGVRIDITGASGSQGLLGPKDSWRLYVFPRGGYAAQDSTGTQITFDSAAIAGRFAVNDWVQAGLNIANIRQVSGVGGDSITVSGSALTITENDRIFLIGQTQPTTTGGSATYTTPATIVRQRDDDAADLYVNSMITTNSDGTAQFFSEPAVYDCLIQDGNRSNQGSIVNLPVGVAEGVSTSQASVFGSTVTINGALGVTGFFTGDTVTVNRALGVTGWATFGQTVTMNSTLGVTGLATFSSGVTFSSGIDVAGGVTISTGTLLVVSQPRAVLFGSGTSQTITTGVSTVLTWDSETFDIGGLHAGSSSNIVIPSGSSGCYLFHAMTRWASTNANAAEIHIRKNGAASIAMFRRAAISEATSLSATGIDNVVAGDFYDVVVLHTTGGNNFVAMGDRQASTFSAAKLF